MPLSISSRIQNYRRQLEIKWLSYQAGKVEKNNIETGRFKTTDPVIISGQPRGGTTWLAEVMAADAHTGIMWEPLHPRRFQNNPELAAMGKAIGNFPYIPENAEFPEAKAYLEKVLTATFLPYELVAHPREVNRNLTAKTEWIVKFCRANMILPWMVKNIDVRPPIYILRHPCAVISSQLRHQAFDNMGNTFEVQQSRYNDIFVQHEHVLRKVNSRIGKLAAWWALDNLLPLNSEMNNKKWITITYEELVLNPEQHLAAIYKRLDKTPPAGLQQKLNKPSSTTKPGAMILDGGNQLEGWKKKLKREEIHLILDIVHEIGIDAYTDASEPDYSKIYPSH
jgi:hypothetical protein